MKRRQIIAAKDRGFGLASAGDGGFGVDVNEGVQSWLKGVRTLEMGGDEFDGREFLAAETFHRFGNREMEKGRHGGAK